MVLKLNSSGEIPNCDIIGSSDAIVYTTFVACQDINATIELFPVTVSATSIVPVNTSGETTVVCNYEDPGDVDGDGVGNSPDEMMASNISGNSLLAETDNCSIIPNGPFLGTCIEGNIGNSCIANEACGPGGRCSMNQQDAYPPGGNGIGDACDCEGNFDCDNDCDGTDVALFKVDFGRSGFGNPCPACFTGEWCSYPSP